jgi:hypothetical protein
LLAFCTFAANRRDAIMYESVSDMARKERAVNLRAGRTVDPHAWRHGNRFLFRAEQINYVHVCSGGGVSKSHSIVSAAQRRLHAIEITAAPTPVQPEWRRSRCFVADVCGTAAARPTLK